MSKGSKIVGVRVPSEMLDAIDAAIANANVNRMDEPYTRSSWIIAAIAGKLDHLARSKKSGKSSRVLEVIEVAKQAVDLALKSAVVVQVIKSALD